MWNIQGNSSEDKNSGAAVSRGSGGNATPSRGSGGFPASRASGTHNLPTVKKGYAGMRSSGANIPAAAPRPSERHSTTVGSSAEAAAQAVLTKMGGNAQPATASTRRSKKGQREELTPGKRRMLIAGAVGCLALAVGLTFVLPHPTEEEQAVAGAGAAAQPHQAENATAAPQIPPGGTAVTGGQRGGPVQGQPRTSQRPFKIALRMSSGGPEEQFKVIQSYLVEGSAADKADAYQALLDMNEWITPRLPELIRTDKTAALTAYAHAATKLKVPGAVEAGIDALKTNVSAGRFELYQMLAEAGAPAAHDFIWAALNNEKGSENGLVWKAVAPYLTEPDANATFKIVCSNRADAREAAEALGTYANTAPRADHYGQLIEPLIRKGEANRAALMAVLTSMEPTTASFYLDAFTSDPDEQLRAIALGALARDHMRFGKALYALRNDASKVVKNECMRGFMYNNNDEVLAACVVLLGEPQYSALAHEVLVVANKRDDLGWKQFTWNGWLAKRKAAATAAARGKS